MQLGFGLVVWTCGICHESPRRGCACCVCFCFRMPYLPKSSQEIMWFLVPSPNPVLQETQLEKGKGIDWGVGSWGPNSLMFLGRLETSWKPSARQEQPRVMIDAYHDESRCTRGISQFFTRKPISVLIFRKSFYNVLHVDICWYSGFRAVLRYLLGQALEEMCCPGIDSRSMLLLFRQGSDALNIRLAENLGKIWKDDVSKVAPMPNGSATAMWQVFKLQTSPIICHPVALTGYFQVPKSFEHYRLSYGA